MEHVVDLPMPRYLQSIDGVRQLFQNLERPISLWTKFCRWVERLDIRPFYPNLVPFVVWLEPSISLVPHGHNLLRSSHFCERPVSGLFHFFKPLRHRWYLANSLPVCPWCEPHDQIEWGLLRCLVWPLIMCEFGERQPLVPIVLVFAKASQILFQPLVRSFRLPISSRMVRSGDVLAYLECLAQSSGIFGHKFGVSIRDNLLRHPKPWVKILE